MSVRDIGKDMLDLLDSSASSKNKMNRIKTKAEALKSDLSSIKSRLQKVVHTYGAKLNKTKKQYKEPLIIQTSALKTMHSNPYILRDCASDTNDFEKAPTGIPRSKSGLSLRRSVTSPLRRSKRQKRKFVDPLLASTFIEDGSETACKRPCIPLESAGLPLRHPEINVLCNLDDISLIENYTLENSRLVDSGIWQDDLSHAAQVSTEADRLDRGMVMSDNSDFSMLWIPLGCEKHSIEEIRRPKCAKIKRSKSLPRQTPTSRSALKKKQNTTSIERRQSHGKKETQENQMAISLEKSVARKIRRFHDSCQKGDAKQIKTLAVL